MHTVVPIIGIMSILLSCINVKELESNPSPWVLNEETIENITVGMTIEQIFRFCGPTLFDIPIIRYPAKNGADYLFYFLPTNEVNWPAPILDGELLLVAVTLKDSKTRSEYYVLPDIVKGEICTGIKFSKQW